MKFSILSIILITFFLQSKGQNSGSVSYTFKSYGGYSYESKLLFKDGNYWYSRRQEPREFTSNEGYEFFHYKEYFDWYYSSSNDSILVISHEHNFPMLYSSYDNNIKWDIKNETKVINGIKVQKAVTKPLKKDSEPWQYENAIAWFSTEMQMPAGPEGYHGVPGLIVYLEYSGMGVFQCTLQSIDFKNVSFSFPKIEQAIEVSKHEIYNYQDIDKKWLKKEMKKISKPN